MSQDAPLIPSQRVVQICLLLVAAIGLFGGTLQMVLGQPDTTPRLDNVHRFMAGIYLGSGLLALWVALTVRRHETLIYLLAFAVLLGGIGRLVSISQVGLPEPAAVWLGYLVPELVLPLIIIAAQRMTDSSRAGI
jgi:peptidoglycan/LPS O-acetylase OafA/YrhL